MPDEPKARPIFRLLAGMLSIALMLPALIVLLEGGRVRGIPSDSLWGAIFFGIVAIGGGRWLR